jgi:hypothetical protein
MTTPGSSHRWFERLQHDLVKRLLWAARDCRELARQPVEGEMIASLFDEEGQPIEALPLWERLCEDAPPGLKLEDFSVALRACMTAAYQNDLEGVLSLEEAFERLRGQPDALGTEFAPLNQSKAP